MNRTLESTRGLLMQCLGFCSLWGVRSMFIVPGIVLLVIELCWPLPAMAQAGGCRCRIFLDRIDYRGQKVGQRFTFQTKVNCYPDGEPPLPEVSTNFPRPHEDPLGNGVIFPLVRGNDFPAIDDPATDEDERALIDRTFDKPANGRIIIKLEGSGTEFDPPPNVNDRGEPASQTFVLVCSLQDKK